MVEILGLVAKVSGELTTIFALLAIILPKSRNAIIKWLKKALEIDRINKSLDRQDEKSKEREELINDLKYTLDAHVDKYNKYTEKAQERDVFFLRTEIDNIYHKYMPLGYITTRAKSDVAKAWELYVAMGGNSYAKEEVEELLALPVRF
jgi:hypothetical protein